MIKTWYKISNLFCPFEYFPSLLFGHWILLAANVEIWISSLMSYNLVNIKRTYFTMLCFYRDSENWHFLQLKYCDPSIFQFVSVIFESKEDPQLVAVRKEYFSLSRDYLTYLPARNALFEFPLIILSSSKNFKFACCLGGFDPWTVLNLLKHAFFCSYRTHALPF